MTLMLRLCCLMLTMLVSISTGAVEQTQLLDEAQIARARVLIENGRHDDALRILKIPSADHPDIIQICFLIGLASSRKAQHSSIESVVKEELLNEAVLAFTSILDERPDLFRVRLELAHVYFLLGNDRESRQHFERVLAENDNDAIAYNIQRHLDVIWDRRRWRGYFNISFNRDSNINQVSSDQVIVLFGLPFQVSNEAQSGVGAVVSGGGELWHPLTDKLRLRIGIDLLVKDYGGRMFDQQSIASHVGPIWKINDRWEFSVLPSTRIDFVGSRRYSRAFGLRIVSTHSLEPRLRIQGDLSWYQRKVDRREHLNGPYMNARLNVDRLISPTLSAGVSLGYAREWPRSYVWKNSSLQLGAGFAVLLSHGLTIDADINFANTRYRGRWFQFTPGGVSRKDRTRSLRVSVQKPNLKFWGLSPKLSLINEVRKSNAALYDYQRNRLEVSLLRNF